MHKKIKKNSFVAFLICLNGYTIISSALAVYIWHKYSFINLSLIEPKHCMPLEEDRTEEIYFINKNHTVRTYFNVFNYHINKIGSRNIFEVQKNDKDIVVLLGDSFMFGYGLNDDETLVHFLISLDGERKYVNLGEEGFNLSNCVERYKKMCKHLPDSKVIVLGITGNDVADLSYMYDKAGKEISRNYKYMLIPYRNFISKNRLQSHYCELISDKTIEDVTYDRYFEYLQKPIDELRRIISGSSTHLVVLCYDTISPFYVDKLRQYCLNNNIYLFMAEDLMNRLSYRDKLPDGHPSKRFNQELAVVLKNQFDKWGILD